MLTETILRMYGASTQRRRYFGASSVSPCPMKTYLNYVRVTNPSEVKDLPNPQLKMLLDDGNYHEASVIDLLRRSGLEIVHTSPKQMEVHIGKGGLIGHPDGFIKLQNYRLLEIKARNYQAFSQFVSEGLEAFPEIRCQVQLYMAGTNLPWPVDSALVIFKHKETARTHDVEERASKSYIDPIIEATDRILDGWVPEPIENPLCKGCHFFSTCWKEEEVDFSGTNFKSMPEIDQKWIEGDRLFALGKMMREEAEVALTRELGTATELQTEGLRVTKNQYVRRQFNTKDFIKENGEEVYNSYCDFNPVTSIRVRELA